MLNNRNLRFYLVTFSFLVLNGLVGKLSSNQENYFGLAKAAWDPNWMPSSFLFSEHAGTRVLFNFLVGPLTAVANFEAISIGLSLLAFSLMAYPLCRFWQRLHDDLCFTSVWLQVIVLGSIGSGAFYGGEWFIGNFEPKVMAYICFWWACWCLLNGQRAWSVLLCVFATYWHVLVGGQTFVLLWCLDLWRERNWKRSFLTGAAFSICVVPFLWHLLKETSTHDVAQPSIDWIYTYFRNPHHTAPFVSIDFFKRKFLKGVLGSIVGTMYLVRFVRKNNTNQAATFAAQAGVIANLFVFIGLAISYLDSNGSLLKFYVFRLSAVAKFFVLMPLGFQIHQFLKTRLGSASHYGISMVALLVVSFGIGGQRFVKRWSRPDLSSMVSAVKQFVPKNGQILNLNEDGSSVDGKWDALPRLSERDWYVSYKFVPAGGDKVREWYMRIARVKSFNRSPASIDPSEFPYILASSRIQLDKYSRVYVEGEYALFVAR